VHKLRAIKRFSATVSFSIRSVPFAMLSRSTEQVFILSFPCEPFVLTFSRKYHALCIICESYNLWIDKALLPPIDLVMNGCFIASDVFVKRFEKSLNCQFSLNVKVSLLYNMPSADDMKMGFTTHYCCDVN
jgi:hypothetical protein